MIQLVIWNGIATIFLKELFALPRPSNVDSRVLLIEKGYPNPTPLYDMGSKSFFDLLPEKVVAFMRIHRFDSFGLPSGHTSNAVSLFGGVLFLFRKTWIKLICILMILLIPLSRMYLGRHFLADILGGYLVGLLFLFIFYRFIFQNDSLLQFVFQKTSNERLDFQTLLFIIYSIIGPLLVLCIPNIDPKYSASLLGINIGFLLVWFKGIPEDEAPVVKRLIRVLIAFAIFPVSNYILGQISENLFSKEFDLVEYIFQFLIMLVTIWGSIELGIKLRLFKRISGDINKC